MDQRILYASQNYNELDEFFNKKKRVLLVHDSSINYLRINDYFLNLPNKMEIEVVRFNNFSPNPQYESVVEGVEIFSEKCCDAIVAIGGGSAIDVAKCIKLYSNLDSSRNYMKQAIVPNDIELLAIPTTAGTGSEATRFAVIYYQGEKQSISDYSCIPSVVVFDESALESLPMYQRKSTMLDAFCHALESYWSINSNEESKKYSCEAIKIILKNHEDYLANNCNTYSEMFRAANLAGKAINITQTTAGHAMCYKITSLFGLSHGHAAALCVNALFPYMINNIDKCIDVRGTDYLRDTFDAIAVSMGCNNIQEAVGRYSDFLASLKLEVPYATDDDISTLVKSVNLIRLKNNPILLSEDVIEMLYRKILGRT